MIKLYSFPGTISLAVHIALEEAGADYELVKVDFLTNEQRSPDYLAINPKSRVPALVTERGVLTEAPALMTYVAQAFPQAKLAPLDDPFAMAQVQAFNTYLCSAVHVSAAHRHRGYRWADDPVAIADMRRKRLGGGGALRADRDGIPRRTLGDGGDYTICDPYLFTLTGWLPATASTWRSFRRSPITSRGWASGRP
uniref:Glutathione S-transferase n=1 Tax=Phenylobacterium glaciei TaxID=2803784 RepID=A0A974P172_9CAUL|nr:glutathione S-transferase [Phenylobacterium glaciei]